MHYVKQFDINGVATKQVACIELHGKPNAATEGHVGVLGVDVGSPTHEVYKCVAVNGSIYTWELLSSGLSIMSASISGAMEESVEFPYDTLKVPRDYLVKIGDLIIDSDTHMYQIATLGSESCVATYTGISLGSIKGDPGDTPYIGGNGNWWIGGTDTGTKAPADTRSEVGSYVGTATGSASITTGGNPYTCSLTFGFVPAFVLVMGGFISHSTDSLDKTARIAHLFPTYGLVDLCTVSGHSSVVVSVDGTTITWAGRSAADVLNYQGVTYHYIAFGKGEVGDGIGDVDTSFDDALDAIIAKQESVLGG